ncbi:MAG: phenylacetate--CoA ligase family protein [Rhodospirillales bacterium]|nr:phenylacetate--CoA ligase family protein [Rhodospirillales bacterium]
MNRSEIPESAISGMTWPALPDGPAARMFALARQLDESQWWASAALEKNQMRQLELLAGHAVRTVPFYKNRLDCLLGILPGDLTLNRWRDIPILHRADLQQAGSELYSTALPKSHAPVIDATSSGSTGRPVTVKITMVTRLFSDAVTLRYHDWAGRDFSAKTCAIEIIQSGSTGEPTGWAPGYISGPMMVLAIDKPVDEQFDWLVAHAPAYLLTYPTNLAALVRHSLDRDERIPGLRQVATMSEVLDPSTKEDCERHWGVPVINAYSAKEIGTIALQCPEHGRLHIQSESLLVEILDETGRACDPGEIGRVVISDLHNFAMPLIRYEIGDYAEMGEPCPCGRGLPVLRRVLGRTRNRVRLPSGAYIWPRFGTNRASRIAPVRQSQLVQVSETEILVNLVVARPLSVEEESALTEMYRGSLGFPFDLRFVYLDEIPRAASGKFEDFRSELAL